MHHAVSWRRQISYPRRFGKRKQLRSPRRGTPITRTSHAISGVAFAKRLSKLPTSQFDNTPMSQYANLPPCGLPVDNATQPFWLSERSRLDRYRSTEQLPSSADLVIVGSGLSGAILAYHLLLERPNANIVMLEAREVCSGASARNGGQVKTDVSANLWISGRLLTDNANSPI